MKVNPNNCWDKALELIKQNVTPQQYETWFKPLVLENFDENTKTILVQVPSPFVYEYLEENFLGLLRTVLCRTFCDGAQLAYRVVTDKENKLTQDIEADPADAEPKKACSRGNQPPSSLDVAMPQLSLPSASLRGRIDWLYYSFPMKFPLSSVQLLLLPPTWRV